MPSEGVHLRGKYIAVEATRLSNFIDALGERVQAALTDRGEGSITRAASLLGIA